MATPGVFFDFDRLGADRRAELIEHHLAAWDARKRSEGQPSWAETFVPVALLGESMPPPVRGRFDLSAPHAGVVLYHRPTGALLHSAGKHDEKLAVMAPDIETISPRESFLGDVFDPAEQSYGYAVDGEESDGFTRANIEMLIQTGGAQLDPRVMRAGWIVLALRRLQGSARRRTAPAAAGSGT